MKKLYLVVFLSFLPMLSFGAPSIRMLGNQAAVSAVASSGVKVTPVKSSEVDEKAVARVGSLRAKTKTVGAIMNATDGSGTRFPAIAGAHSYNVTSTPKITGTTTTAVPTNVDVDAIIAAVTQNIENNYYNKDVVYNNDEFRQAVIDVVPVVDDPRIDAIRIGSRPSHSDSLPSGSGYSYGYIWIEEN